MPRVDVTENYYRCRQRDPNLFAKLRYPEYARRIADKQIKGSRVITGRLKRSKKWVVQSVLIPRKRGMNRERAVKAARRIKKKVEGK